MRLIYFVLTFAATWAFWLAPGALPGSHQLGAGVVGTLFLFLGIFTPAFAAIAMTARAEGQIGVAALIKQLFKWNVAARWYLFAVTYIVVIKLTAVLVNRVAFGAWPEFGAEPIVLMIAATAFSLVTFGQSGEELGWRGFALPKLADRIGYGWAAIVIGVIWAAWHYPLFFMDGVARPGYSILLFTIQVTGISVAVTWLYVRTGGSLWLTMLMHSAVNNLGPIVRTADRAADDPLTLDAPPMVWITALLLWVPATYFLVRMPPTRTK